jgi:hypothetical protein
MRLSQYGLVAAIGVAGLVNLTARADEERVELKDLPAVVRQAADKTVPEARWTEATKETKDGKTTYELNGADAKGRETHVTLTSDGQVEVVETVLSVTDLPKLVVDVLKTLPRVKWTEATEKVEDGMTTYEVSGTDLKDHESNASVTADGQSTIRTELDLTEVPGVVSDALKAKLPKFQPDSVMSVIENGRLNAYAFEGDETGGAEMMEVSVSADGKTVKIDDDDDDDDDD